MRPPRRALLAVTAVAALAALVPCSPAAGEARTVRVRIALAPDFLEARLREQLFPGPEARARIAVPGDPCNRLVLGAPAVSVEGEALRLRAPVEARSALASAGRCWLPMELEGELAILQAPYADSERPVVHFALLDSQLAVHRAPPLLPVGWLWGWVQGGVARFFEGAELDLGPPLGELRAVLPLFLPPAVAGRVGDSLALDAVRVEPAGVRVTVRFQVDVPAAGPPLAEPPLAAGERARLEAALRGWDAFLGFVLKQAGRDAPGAALRAELLEVMIEGRQEISRALTDPHPAGGDPVRRLFLRTWSRLAPLLRDLDPKLPADGALRYLAFVAAGDALAALDAVGPAAGLEISSDGLRRLARVLVPGGGEDPLAWSEQVDPELREVFGFGPPLPVPPGVAPGTSPPAEPEPTAPGGSGPRPVEPGSGPGRAAPGAGPGARRGALERVLAWLWPAASAEPATGPGDEDLEALARRLSGRVAERAGLEGYLPLVRALLSAAAERVARRDALEDAPRPIFVPLVLATAWQESCWRQWVRRDGRVEPLRSGVGAVGLMQVHERVWRGFYEPRLLRDDIGYNATAGAEILLHYLRDYAVVRAEDAERRRPEALARATYAMYNGGPAHRLRWRAAGGRASLRAIDAAFLEKYRAMRRGGDEGVARCLGA